MAKGTVKFFDDQKGYGFIVPENGGRDIFVHKTGVKTTMRLTEGMRVQFDEKQDHRGLKAVNVELA